MLKVSVIVPVYNVESYLPLCLESIRKQSYPNIEIICVDDGSRDRSSAILSMYESIDQRVRVIRKSNGGLSSARNAGISESSGDIVCFVDSDDMIVPGAISAIVSAFESTSADVVTFGGEAYPQFRSTPWLDRILSPRDIEYDAFSMDIFTEEASEPFAWRTACRRDFLISNNIQFDEELRFGEDKLFHYSIYPRSSHTVFISDKLYLYRIGREDSLMSSRADNAHLRLYDHLRIYQRIVLDWLDGGFIEQYGNDLLLLGCDFLLVDILSSPKPIRTDLLNYLGSIWTTYFTHDHLSQLLADKQYGKLCSAVLDDRRHAFGVSYKLMFYAYTLRTDPKDFLIRIVRRVKQAGIIKKLCGSISRRLPLSRRASKSMFDEVIFEQQDAFKRDQAFNMLQIEHEHCTL